MNYVREERLAHCVSIFSLSWHYYYWFLYHMREGALRCQTLQEESFIILLCLDHQDGSLLTPFSQQHLDNRQEVMRKMILIQDKAEYENLHDENEDATSQEVYASYFGKWDLSTFELWAKDNKAILTNERGAFLGQSSRLEKSIFANLETYLTTFHSPWTDDFEERLTSISLQQKASHQLWQDELHSVIFKKLICSNFLIIAGGPGTGKTTLLGEMLLALTSFYGYTPQLKLVAPTGRAATRMKESLAQYDESLQHLKSQTIHSFLKLDEFGNTRYSKKNPIRTDIVIVDEASMLDAFVFNALLQAILPSTKLVLLGDANQLPSVNRGAIFADLTTHRGHPDFRLREHFFWLDKTYRFSDELSVLTQALLAEQGNFKQKVIELNASSTHFTWQNLSENNGVTYHYLIDLWRQKEQELSLNFQDLLDYVSDQQYGQTRENCDISPFFDLLKTLCILTPKKVGLLGSTYLNTLLAKNLVSARSVVPIMNATNQPHLSIYNGDLGWRVALSHKYYFVFQLNNDYVIYSEAELQHYDFAYAKTIHKSQGSEYEHVVLLLPEDQRFLSKELVYTGITRMKKQLTILGDKSILDQPIETKSMRYSNIAQWTIEKDIVHNEIKGRINERENY